MATVTITLTDDPTSGIPNNVKLRIDFGGGGADPDSAAHNLSVQMALAVGAELTESEVAKPTTHPGVVGHG